MFRLIITPMSWKDSQDKLNSIHTLHLLTNYITISNETSYILVHTFYIWNITSPPCFKCKTYVL